VTVVTGIAIATLAMLGTVLIDTHI